MFKLLKIGSAERSRFLLLAFLLFFNAMILELNEVVATSGFVSNIGARELLIVWAIDMAIIIVTSGVYTLFVDRTRRGSLALILYGCFCIFYFTAYFLFISGHASDVLYGILLVVNDQQYLVLPLTVWTLANDIFSIAEAKRLFPILGIAAFVGGMSGNAISAGLAQTIEASYQLLLLSGVVILLCGAVLFLFLRRIPVGKVQRKREGETFFDALKEGVGFVKDVPIFRFLTFAMILLGISLNAIEFDFLLNISTTYTNVNDLQAFYGTFKLMVAISLFIIQGLIASRLLNRMGFKYIFLILPVMMCIALSIAFFSPGVVGVIIGNYLVRISKVGIDEPSGKAFQGLVPDERRGRVSAFMDGYLYPFGSILGCIIIGITMFVLSPNIVSIETARAIYLGIAISTAVIAFILILQIRTHYDTSLLNWRLKRRKRASSLDFMDF